MFCFCVHSERPANITRNLIGVADNNNVHSIGSQKQRERNASLSCAAVSGEERCVTTLITTAKETRALRDNPNNGCEGDYQGWSFLPGILQKPGFVISSRFVTSIYCFVAK